MHDSSESRPNMSAKSIGNKAANLYELELLTQKHSELNVSVPPFLPLNNEQIKSLLEPKLTKTWNAFLIRQKKTDDPLKLTEESKRALKFLREFIEKQFKTPEVISSLQAWNTDFLEKEADHLLMVRSTGEEDSIDLANPGGNESVPSVKPSIQEVSIAIGRVVASYFSEKSLIQRLRSGDSLDKPTFTPVLLQRMTGESLQEEDSHENVICSGVMYTDADLTRIQVAPGHGALVVENQAPCDTFEVTNNHNIYAAIALKKRRLVPDHTTLPSKTNHGLKWKNNPSSLHHNPCIPDQVILRLNEMGRILEEHYGMPMDIEFVYDPKEDRIDLVQARPIPKGDTAKTQASSTPPEHIQKLKQSIQNGVVKRYNAQVITPAGFASVVITSPAQVLICRDIETALRIYLQQENSSIQAVLVQDTAIAYSHAAAEFTSKAIPVLQIKELDTIRDWTTQDNTVLVIDPQRNYILDYTARISPENAKETLESEGFLANGLFALPPLPITPQQHPMTETAIETIYDKFKTEASDLDQEHIYTQLLNNIELLETSTDHTEIHRVLNIIRRTLARIDQIDNLYLTNEHLLVPIIQQSMLLCEEIEQILTGSDLTQRLSLVSRLKSLLSSPGHQDIISNSIPRILQETKLLQEFAQSNPDDYKKYNSTQRTILVQFLKLKHYAFTKEAQNRWVFLIANAVKTRSNLEKWFKISQFYTDNHLMPYLINDRLHDLFTQRKTIDVILDELEDECTQFQEFSLEYGLDEIQQSIYLWQSRITEWSDRAKFDVLWKEYSVIIKKLIDALDFNEEDDPLKKRLILNTLIDLTELMDRTIKSAKSSTEYSDDTGLLVSRFAKLLTPYHELMEKCVRLLPEEVCSRGNADGRHHNSKQTILTGIKISFSKLQNKVNSDQLQPSNTVSIAACTIGVSASFVRQFNDKRPTLEDLFSLMHQNILASVNYLNDSTRLPVECLPEALHPLIIAMNNTNGLELLRVDYTDSMFSIEYNQPFESHSGKYRIEYDAITKKVTFHGFMLGQDAWGRMDRIQKRIEQDGLKYNYDVKKQPEYSTTLTVLEFAWVFDVENFVAQAPLLLNSIIDYGKMTNYEFQENSVDSRRANQLMAYYKRAIHKKNEKFESYVQSITTVSELQTAVQDPEAEFIWSIFLNHPLCDSEILKYILNHKGMILEELDSVVNIEPLLRASCVLQQSNFYSSGNVRLVDMLDKLLMNVPKNQLQAMMKDPSYTPIRLKLQWISDKHLRTKSIFDEFIDESNIIPIIIKDKIKLLFESKSVHEVIEFTPIIYESEKSPQKAKIFMGIINTLVLEDDEFLEEVCQKAHQDHGKFVIQLIHQVNDGEPLKRLLTHLLKGDSHDNETYLLAIANKTKRRSTLTMILDSSPSDQIRDIVLSKLNTNTGMRPH